MCFSHTLLQGWGAANNSESANSLFGLLTYYQCVTWASCQLPTLVKHQHTKSKVLLFPYSHGNRNHQLWSLFQFNIWLHPISHWIMCGLFLKLYSKRFNINYYLITVILQNTCITQTKWFTNLYTYFLERESGILEWQELILVSFLDLSTPVIILSIVLFIFIILYFCCNPYCTRRIASSSSVANCTIKFKQFMSGSLFLQRPALAGQPGTGQCCE